jgi:hypothetical protein
MAEKHRRLFSINALSDRNVVVIICKIVLAHFIGEPLLARKGLVIRISPPCVKILISFLPLLIDCMMFYPSCYGIAELGTVRLNCSGTPPELGAGHSEESRV